MFVTLSRNPGSAEGINDGPEQRQRSLESALAEVATLKAS